MGRFLPCVCRENGVRRHQTKSQHWIFMPLRHRSNGASIIAQTHKLSAIAVSGGADSTALCILASHWKCDKLSTTFKNGKFINGLMSFVVDHGLRVESSKEAELVQNRVRMLGMQCDILKCEWPNGLPTQGHVQEAARYSRYRLLLKKCKENQIGVLLTAHHADDQAELLMLRLSRNSGVMGLAGMAFISQLYHDPAWHLMTMGLVQDSLLLVRPLLCFRKDDLYKICKISGKKWVEDPTNQNEAFARNKIRKRLNSVGSCDFKTDVQTLIAYCRRVRSLVHGICSNLIEETVTVQPDYGYVVLDVQKLSPRTMNTSCISTFMSLVLQFVSQKLKPVRGNAVQILVEYLRNNPCKGSITVGGCNICPLPGSKGLKVLICFSSEQPQSVSCQRLIPLPMSVSNYSTTDIEEIMCSAETSSNVYENLDSEVPLWNFRNSDKIIIHAMKAGIISDSTMSKLLVLKDEFSKDFYDNENVEKSEMTWKSRSCKEVNKHDTLPSDQPCYFMNRFVVSWGKAKFNDHQAREAASVLFSDGNRFMSLNTKCKACPIKNSDVWIRHMKESDWNYLSRFANEKSKGGLFTARSINSNDQDSKCAQHLLSKIHHALSLLKTIPLPARKGLPVLVNGEGCLLGIPSISYMCCPLVTAFSAFRPLMSLGGGYSSWI